MHACEQNLITSCQQLQTSESVWPSFASGSGSDNASQLSECSSATVSRRIIIAIDDWCGWPSDAIMVVRCVSVYRLTDQSSYMLSAYE